MEKTGAEVKRLCTEILDLDANRQIDFVMATDNIHFQFQVAGSCDDYDFFSRMTETTRRNEVNDAIIQMPEEVIEEIYRHYFEGLYS